MHLLYIYRLIYILCVGEYVLFFLKQFFYNEVYHFTVSYKGKGMKTVFFLSSFILLSAWFLAPVYPFPMRTESWGSHLLYSLHPQASGLRFLSFPKSLKKERLWLGLVKLTVLTTNYYPSAPHNQLITLITNIKGRKIYIPRKTKALARACHFSTLKASCYCNKKKRNKVMFPPEVTKNDIIF